MRLPREKGRSTVFHKTERGNQMLTAKQLRAVELLLEGKMSLKQIASQVGVSESTLSRWKKDEAFSAFYAQGLRRVLNDAAAEALRTEMQILLHSDSDSSFFLSDGFSFFIQISSDVTWSTNFTPIP